MVSRLLNNISDYVFVWNLIFISSKSVEVGCHKISERKIYSQINTLFSSFS